MSQSDTTQTEKEAAIVEIEDIIQTAFDDSNRTMAKGTKNRAYTTERSTGEITIELFKQLQMADEDHEDTVARNISDELVSADYSFNLTQEEDQYTFVVEVEPRELLRHNEFAATTEEYDLPPIREDDGSVELVDYHTDKDRSITLFCGDIISIPVSTDSAKTYKMQFVDLDGTRELIMYELPERSGGTVGSYRQMSKSQLEESFYRGRKRAETDGVTTYDLDPSDVAVIRKGDTIPTNTESG